jgi:hypothetical protein
MTPQVAIVTRSYVIDGRPYADVSIAGVGGMPRTGLPVMSIGGGGESLFVHIPLKASLDPFTSSPDDAGAGAQVLLFRPHGKLPFVLGPIAHVFMDLIAIAVDTENTKPLQLAHDSFIARVGDAFTTIDPIGDIRHAPAKDRHIREHLTGDGTFAVSRDGRSDEHPVLSNPWADQTNILIAEINRIGVHLGAEMSRLGAQVALLTTVSFPLVPYTPIPYVPNAIGSVTASEGAAAAVSIPSDRSL